ncbi:MAG: hypothetical protein K0S39_5951 [Paenibacillus sp.]|jgi:hypothetical protein|nr:hypothetical protein [Paenibacillus sp.]
MNRVFMVVFALLLLVNMLFDLKRIRKQHKSLKWLYVTVYTITSALFVCTVVGIRIPMPTRFFINHVSPWVFSFIFP